MLCHLKAAAQIVVAVNQYFGFDNRNDVIFLPQRGIASQRVGIGGVTRLAGQAIRHGIDSTPLGKPRAQLCIFSQPRSQPVESLGHFFSRVKGQILRTGINLDTRDNALFLQRLHKWTAVSGVITQGLIEQNCTANVIA